MHLHAQMFRQFAQVLYDQVGPGRIGLGVFTCGLAGEDQYGYGARTLG